MTPSTRTQRVLVWSGLTMMVLWLGGWMGFADLVPPPSPNDSAEEIADFYRDDSTGLRVGILLSIFGATFVAPFVTVITLQLRRAEGGSSPWTVLQFMLAPVLVLAFIVPLFFLMNATFRTDRDPTEIQAFNDMGWTMFIGFVSSAMMQFTAIALAIFKDKRTNPVFPRWVAYLNIWCAVTFFPGTINFFVHTGPLAWRGVLAWWVPLTAFTIWIVVMTVMLRRAIQHEEREEAEDGGAQALQGLDDPRLDLDELAGKVAQRLAIRRQGDEQLGVPGASAAVERDP